MSFTYINREIYPKMLVQDEPLDDNYAKGYSYDDYINGNPAPWIELGEEQLAFKEANPKATVKEIIEAKLDESRLLNEEKSVKYEEIRTYETGNLYEFFLDDQNIYIPEHDRRNALSDGAIAGKITIMGLEFDITEGKILIGMMDKYDNDLMSALGDKQKQINLATTVEQVRAIDVQSGYPDKISVTTAYVQQQAKEKDASDPQKVAVKFSRMVVNKIEELTATLKVTAAGGQTANVTVTQAAGDSTIELDKETINLDVNGTQQTVNVTSNDSWTWAQAAARTVLRMMGR